MGAHSCHSLEDALKRLRIETQGPPESPCLRLGQGGGGCPSAGALGGAVKEREASRQGSSWTSGIVKREEARATPRF